jgi:hypothetical protein
MYVYLYVCMYTHSCSTPSLRLGGGEMHVYVCSFVFMYVCMHVCMHIVVLTPLLLACRQGGNKLLFVCLCVCVCVCIHVYINTYEHKTCIYTGIQYKHIRACVHTCTYIHTSIQHRLYAGSGLYNVYACIHTYIRMYIQAQNISCTTGFGMCIHIYTNTYIDCGSFVSWKF